MIALIPILKLYDFKQTTTLFEGYDYLRRGCGIKESYDALATDYSQILTSIKNFKPFCNLLESMGKISDFSCELLDTGNENLAQNSKQFFRKIRDLNNVLEEYPYGYNIDDKTVCLKEEATQTDIAYLCNYEFIEYYNKRKSASETGQVFSQAEFKTFSYNLDSDDTYLLNFCVEIPSNGKFVQQELQKALGIKYYVFAQDVDGDSIIDKITYIGKNLGSVFAEQVKDQWDTIVYGLLVSICITIIYFIITRFLVKATVWLTILGLFAILVYGGIVLLLSGKELGQQIDYEQTYFGQHDQELSNKKSLYDGFGWTLIALAILIFLITICCFNTIRIATGVIKQTMIALGDVPGIFVQPIIGVICCIIWLGFCILFGYTIYLDGSFDSKLNQFDFVTIKYDDDNNLVREYDVKQGSIFAFWVFGAIWGLFFIYSFNEYLINAAIAQWYFTLNKSGGKLMGVYGKSIKYTFKAFGTICVTSFITTLVVFIRFVFEYVLKRLQQSSKVTNSKALKIGTCVIRCLLRMLQKITQWINRNIQVYSAITGDGYCKSMKNSVKLLLSRLLSNLFAKTLTKACIFLGQILSICGGTVVCAYITYKRKDELYWAPILVSLGCNFVLSFYLFEITEIAVDTIYFSFLYEETYLLRERETTGVIYAPGDLKSLLK